MRQGKSRNYCLPMYNKNTPNETRKLFPTPRPPSADQRKTAPQRACRHSKRSIGRRIRTLAFHQRVRRRDPAVVGCMAQLSLAFPSQCDTFLLPIQQRLACVNSNDERRTAATAAAMDAFFSCSSNTFTASSSLLLFTHHLFRSSQYLAPPYPHASLHLILPRPYPVSLSFHHTTRLSRSGGVDLLLQPRSCIFLFFHNPTCSSTPQALKSKQKNIHRASLAQPLLTSDLPDPRSSRPSPALCAYQRSTFWDRILAQNDSSLNYDTLLLDDSDHALPHLVPGAFRHPCFCAG